MHSETKSYQNSPDFKKVRIIYSPCTNTRSSKLLTAHAQKEKKFHVYLLPEGLVPWLLDERLTSLRFLSFDCARSSIDSLFSLDETNLISEFGVDTLEVI